MKTVKAKLLVSYTITIFVVLVLVSSSGLYLFSNNYEQKTLAQLDTAYLTIENIIKTEQEVKFSAISTNNNIYIIINKNKKLLYSDLSKENSEKIVNKLNLQLKAYNPDFHEYDGYIEVLDYIVKYETFDMKKDSYEIYVGVYEYTLDEFLEHIIFLVILLNLILFLILLLLGYSLINNTISPLKHILDDLSKLKEEKNLSARLIKQNTDDEFQRLTQTFNEMLDWIENSVENIKQFSSDASHELRTPLTIIQGEIELYKKGNLSKEQIQETFENIDIEQKKLQNIINDLLLLAKLDKEALEVQTCFLDKVIFDAIELNLNKIEQKELELKFDIQEDLKINFNEKYLFIVINNLLSNAIKYTFKGFIQIEAKKLDEKVYFSINDTGIGISQENLPKIFERFYRIDEARTNAQEGIGIGLAIVKKICESFEYKIDVKSKIDKGTSFIISK